MILPAPPNTHALAVLLLTVVALILFTRDRIPLETSSLLVLVLLAVGFEIFPFDGGEAELHAVDFFHGFGHEALIAVCALMIAGQGIVRTGALEPVGRAMARLWKISPDITFLITLLLAAFISAFINNVPVVVLFLPILITVSVRTGMPASSVLMPMGFSTLLGGASTAIGTSTNLLVIAVAAEMGLGRMGMFDFVVPALMAGSIGIAYLWLVAPWIIPAREQPLTDISPRIFAAHLAILPDSPVVGQTLTKTVELTDGAMKVSGIERGEGRYLIPFPELILNEGDHLVVRDTPDRLKEYEKVLKGTLYTVDAEEVPVNEDHPLKADDQQIAEIAVVEGSSFIGRTLAGLRFADRYGLITLALHRSGRDLDRHHTEIGDILLRAGDVLLVQGPRDEIGKMKKDEEFLVIDATTDVPFTSKAPLAMGLMIAIVACSAMGILPISISAPCGALLMIVTGCMNWKDATCALSAQVILIVAASLALGRALLETGAAEYLATVFVVVAGDASPVMVISGLMLLMAILTNIVSNNAAAVIGTPIAISIATQMGQPPEPYVLAVLFGANMSYATPMAYKTNLLVMNAGKYTFTDFLRVGVPLLLIMWVALSFILPMIYGVS
ncbi:MAG: SLC13 family permease [Desulfofustis sp.]|nr:SLC13 family permease [Desulfofustis sp.]